MMAIPTASLTRIYRNPVYSTILNTDVIFRTSTSNPGREFGRNW